MAMVTKTVDFTVPHPLTDEEKNMIRKAEAMPIAFDEDCPETTPERALKFRRVNPPRSVNAHGA